MLRMDLAGAGVDQAAAPQGKEQAAGGYEISVEAFEQRQQGCGENDVDDPARAHGALEGNCGHELLTGQLVPWRYECNCGDDDCVEENADQDGHPDGFEKSLAAKLGSGFFGGLADGFESGHEIRDDLNHEEERNQWCVGEERREVARRSFADAERYENDEQ